MKVVFSKSSGDIICELPNDQNVDVFFSQHSLEFINNLDFIMVDKVDDIHNYKVVDKQLVIMGDIEIDEIRTYGRTLSSEDRLLNKLRPSVEEIKKAEQTIDILNLLSEVM